MYSLSAGTLIEAAKLQSNFDDLSSGVGDLVSNSLETTRYLIFEDHVVSGAAITADSAGVNRNASMSAMVAFITGKYVTRAAVSARTYTASKDTYVDVDYAGTLTYTEVSNGAASPSLAANSIRLGIVVTGATTIASANSIYQGRWSTATPLSTPTGANFLQQVVDNAGVFVCPREPMRRIIGMATRVSTPTTGAPGGSPVAYNGMSSFCVNVEPYTDYEIIFIEPAVSGFSGTGEFKILPYLSATTGAYTTALGTMEMRIDGTTGIYMNTIFNSGNNSGKMFLDLKLDSSGWSGTMSLNASTTGRWAQFYVRKMQS